MDADVDFDLMLRCAKRVIEEFPLDASDTSYVVDKFVETKKSSPSKFGNGYTGAILYQYSREQRSKGNKPFGYEHHIRVLREDDEVAKEHEAYQKAQKAKYATAACKAFRAVTGHSFTSAKKLRAGKLWGRMTEGEQRIARYNLYALKSWTKVRCKYVDPEIADQLEKENEALFWACLIFQKQVDSLNAFKEIKEKFRQGRRNPITQSGWKFLSKQTKHWVIRASRQGIASLSFAANNKLRDGMLRNPLFSMLVHLPAEGQHVFIQNYKKSGQPMKRWVPLPVVYLDRVGYVCRELQMIRDYLIYNRLGCPATTVAGLLRYAEAWHEEHRHRTHETLGDVEFPKLDGLLEVHTVGKVTFQLIGDSKSLRGEGKKMHHCVGCYARRCYAGEYVVWRVTYKDEIATLGCRVSEIHGGIQYDQCYGVCNAYPSKEINTAVDKFIKKQNEDIKNGSSVSLGHRRDDSEHRPPAEVRRGEIEELGVV